MGWWSVNIEKNAITPISVFFGGHMASQDSRGRDLLIGDAPADIMGEALERIVTCYREEWGRKPYAEEIYALFRFCAEGEFESASSIKESP